MRCAIFLAVIAGACWATANAQPPVYDWTATASGVWTNEVWADVRALGDIQFAQEGPVTVSGWAEFGVDYNAERIHLSVQVSSLHTEADPSEAFPVDLPTGVTIATTGQGDEAQPYVYHWVDGADQHRTEYAYFDRVGGWQGETVQITARWTLDDPTRPAGPYAANLTLYVLHTPSIY